MYILYYTKSGQGKRENSWKNNPAQYKTTKQKTGYHIWDETDFSKDGARTLNCLSGKADTSAAQKLNPTGNWHQRWAKLFTNLYKKLFAHCSSLTARKATVLSAAFDFTLGWGDLALFAIFENWTHCCPMCPSVIFLLWVQYQNIGDLTARVSTSKYQYFFNHRDLINQYFAEMGARSCGTLRSACPLSSNFPSRSRVPVRHCFRVPPALAFLFCIPLLLQFTHKWRTVSN